MTGQVATLSLDQATNEVTLDTASTDNVLITTTLTTPLTLRLQASVKPGARLNLLLTTPPGARLDAHINLSLAEGAAAHVTLHTPDPAELLSHATATLEGRDATLELNGVYTAQDDHTVHHETLVTHLAPHTTSRQLFKGTATDTASVDFGGLIKVTPEGLKTDAAQVTRHMLLSDDARALARPHLEIYADDVSVAHGASTGQLDPEQLFYLQQRGIPEAQARALLTDAFLREVTDRLPQPLKELLP